LTSLDALLQMRRRAAAARPDGTTWGAIEAAAAGDLPGLAPRTRNALAEFAALVRRLRSRVGVLSLPELLDDALEASGYRAMLADGSEEGEDRWANLLELRQDLAPFGEAVLLKGLLRDGVVWRTARACSQAPPRPGQAKEEVEQPLRPGSPVPNALEGHREEVKRRSRRN